MFGGKNWMKMKSLYSDAIDLVTTSRRGFLFDVYRFFSENLFLPFLAFFLIFVTFMIRSRRIWTSCFRCQFFL